VLPATADAVETLLRSAPQCHVLTTSREPLRADGERVHDLAPLQVPDEHASLSAHQATTWSGIAPVCGASARPRPRLCVR